MVNKNFTFLKTPFLLHGVKTVVLGTYRCRTVLENYRRLIITFMCQRNERRFYELPVPFLTAYNVLTHFVTT